MQQQPTESGGYLETILASLNGSPLLTREQAAHYLGVSPDTLAIWASTKRYPLPYVRIGRLAKYRKTDLDAFIESRTMNMAA